MPTGLHLLLHYYVYNYNYYIFYTMGTREGYLVIIY